MQNNTPIKYDLLKKLIDKVGITNNPMSIDQAEQLKEELDNEGYRAERFIGDHNEVYLNSRPVACNTEIGRSMIMKTI